MHRIQERRAQDALFERIKYTALLSTYATTDASMQIENPEEVETAELRLLSNLKGELKLYLSMWGAFGCTYLVDILEEGMTKEDKAHIFGVRGHFN